MAAHLQPQPSAVYSADAEARRFGMLLGSFFLGLALALITCAYLFSSYRQGEARAAAHAHLGAIADLKLGQITNWQQERFSDAKFFGHARFVAEDVHRFLAGPDSTTNREAVIHWLNLLKGGERYHAVMLIDSNLQFRIALPESAAEPPELLRSLFDEAIRTREVVRTDLHQDYTNREPHLDLLFPVYAPGAQVRDQPMAAVVLKLDARQFLFPLIQSWPTPSKTAETLLVRQEGRDVLYLNDLRHRQGTALGLRLPLSSARLPAARVLRGETQAVEGVDYRGVRVVAAGRKVPGTSWYLIAKMDEEEIYAPLRQQMRWLIAVLGALLLAAAASITLLWRQRSAQFLRRELALAERVGHLMRHANEVILLMNAEGRITEANECALKTYGYRQEEICLKSLRDLHDPKSQGARAQDFERLRASGSIVYESIHRRKDGTAFPVEASIRLVSLEGESSALSIVRDISQHKAHQREIERLNRLYAALSEVSQAVVRNSSRQGLLQEICRVLVDFGGFPMACMVWRNEPAGEFIPVAASGAKPEDLGYLRVSLDENLQGPCPIAAGVRLNRLSLCNNLTELPETIVWRDAVLGQGWRSLAAFPVAENGSTGGVLMVFAPQTEVFGEKEVHLLEEAARDISVGLENLRKDQLRRQTEQALGESEARFRAIFDNAGLGIGEVDERGVIQVVNQRWCRILGRTREQLLGMTIQALTHPEDRAATARLNAELWAGRLPLISYEKRYLRGDGSPVWVRVTVTNIRAADDRPIRAIGMVEDISARRETEEQLRLQSAALDSAANATVITRRDGTIQWVNAAFERLTGYTAAIAVGQTPRFLRSGQQDRAFYEDLWETILSGDVWRGELVNKRNDGSVYDEEMTITPVKDSRGEITHFIAIKLDISQRKQAEAALMQARDNLERIVAERTAQLVEANANLQTFAHTAAHDLRAPLRTISAFSSLALDEYAAQLDATAQSYLKRVRQAADQMDCLLNDLLEYSQLTQTAMTLEPANLQAAVQQALTLLQADIRANDAAITVADPMPGVLAHSATLVLILSNFISNALKFVAPGRRPQIHIEARQEGGFVRLSVSDNGIGIESRGLEKIFQVFQRLHGKHTYPGTGLGLAIARKGAERMGGRVGVESEPGKGSRFWVELKTAEPRDSETG
jgi:PAS domain S-box-containing protein